MTAKCIMSFCLLMMYGVFFFILNHFTTLIESLSKGNPYEQEVINNLKQHILLGLNTVLQI